jgi:hypothetical protein
LYELERFTGNGVQRRELAANVASDLVVLVGISTVQYLRTMIWNQS